jgi:hypothetical protein
MTSASGRNLNTLFSNDLLERVRDLPIGFADLLMKPRLLVRAGTFRAVLVDEPLEMIYRASFAM